MAYIGQSIKNGTFSVLDTSGNTYNGSNTTFSLGTQVGSPAQLLVSHDGVVQKPGTDYTLATGGTQITFTTAPASGASIFIVEISGAVGGPMNTDINGSEFILDVDGDTSITADTDDQIDIKIAGADDFKFSANAMNVLSGSTLTIDSGATIANSGTATGFGGITMADQWRLSAAITSPTQNADAVISSNWERNDSTAYGVLGSGMSESSGIFSFPVTGFYLVRYVMMHSANADTYFGGGIEATTNNSSYSDIAEQFNYFDYTGSTVGGGIFCESLLDVTDVSNIKVRFTYNTNAGTYINGNSSENQTYATFVRLGDT